MRSYSQNPRSLQEEPLSIIEDKSLRTLVEIAADAYRRLPSYSKARKKIDEEIASLLEKSTDGLIHKTTYPKIYWIGAYVLYTIPEYRKLLEDYKRLNYEIEYRKEKLSQLEPEYVKLTSTIKYLKDMIKSISKKIDSTDRLINSRETKLGSLTHPVKRNKLIKEIEELQKERDELFEMYHGTVAKLEKMMKRDIMEKYIGIESEIRSMEHEKYIIERKVYQIMDEMS